ncbi:ABC transporter substrate-binding protein [Hyphomicrobium sp. CS1BSMeth3]|uniref:ABC transporter substrate-binding protein n=1 Tax=Hyphomicrobium sp. CS1BSMeth3 TaxID=1892844 RepID=UPI0009FB042D|nr:ABC transporter substrate-binding protein [Hyphomicrobium sp. CS1BSMeth3]
MHEIKTRHSSIAGSKYHRPWHIVAMMLLAAAVFVPTKAAAEVGEVRIVRQPSILSLALFVMDHEKLVEKAAKEQGLPDLKVTWSRLAGGAAVNDAMLSGAVDFAAGGVGPLIVLWDRSKGGKGDIKAAGALSDLPMILNTNNPNIKSLDDFNEKNKIALPAVKTSMQAVLLQMAAAKKWGDKGYDHYDRFTVSLAHADATASLISGSGSIAAHFAAPPWDAIQLRSPNVHKVLDSSDIIGGPATCLVLYTTQKFHDQNPKTYAAVVTALGEAMKLISLDKGRAAKIYLALTNDKINVEELVKILEEPSSVFKISPSGIKTYADFMHKIGRVKTRTESWKDLFFPSAHSLPGS